MQPGFRPTEILRGGARLGDDLARDSLAVSLDDSRGGLGNVGCFISPTLIADRPVYDSQHVYLTKVLLTQELTDACSVFAGKMDTLDGEMNDVARGRGKTQFSNTGLVFNPIAGATVPSASLRTCKTSSRRSGRRSRR